jgi:hypothetical protein
MKARPSRAKVHVGPPIQLQEARRKRTPIAIDLYTLDTQLGAFLKGLERRLDPEAFARFAAAAHAVLDELGIPSFSP